MSGGFKWVGSQSSDPEGKVRTFDVASNHSTLLAIGDVAVITSTASADGTQQADAGAATGALTGVIVGVVPDFATENFTQTGLPASVGGKVMVNVDPHAEYEVDVANGPLAAADVGLNAPSVVTEASTSGGLTVSNMTINSTGKNTTATIQWRILALKEDDSGTLGGRARVRLNNSTTIAGAAGV